MNIFYRNAIKKIIPCFAVLTAVILFMPVSASAESNFFADYDSKIFTKESGLESTSINSVAQTEDGYIWLGSYTGLYRYNGTRFTLVDSDEGIGSVRSLFVDSSGRMWVGTNDSGAAYYDSDGTLHFFDKQNGLSSNSIRCFCEGTDGSIYIAAAGALCVVLPNGEISEVSNDEELSYVVSLAVSDSGVIFGVNNSGTVFAIDNGKIIKSNPTIGAGESFSCVCYDGNGAFLVGTSESSVYRCMITGNAIVSSKFISVGKISGLGRIKDDGNGGYWICADNGIGHIGSDMETEIIHYDNFNSSVSDIICDYQGNYWLVSTRQGAMKLSLNPFKNVNAKYGFAEEVANAVEIYGGSIYIGYDSGLKIINKETGQTVENELTDRCAGIRVRNIYADSNGLIWVSTYGAEGLLCYDPSGASAIKTFSEASGGTLGSRFRFVTELSDGIILAASSMGLTYIQDGEVIHTLGTEYGLEVPQILRAVEFDDGTVLAGSDGDGIYIIKGGRIFRHIGENDGLTSLVIMSIVKYKDIYFIVTGNSLFTMDSQGNIDKIDSFRYSNNYDIITDEETDTVWILSSAGIFAVNGDELAADNCSGYTLYDERSGLSTSITSNSWNVVDEDGTLYLCCSTGLMSVSLKELSTIPEEFKMAVSEVALGDGTVISPEECEGYDGKFVIPAYANRISFELSVLNYTLSDPELYIYLDGFDENGIYVSQSELDSVSFTNLPYGTYYFHLQLLSEDYGTVAKEAVYLVEKEAQFFEQTVFKVYLIFVVAAAIAFITWVVTKIGSLNVIKRQYEEIRAAKDEAENANNAKSQFLANISHEIRTPINTILGMDEMILRECDDDHILRYAGDIKSSGAMLLSIVNDILSISKIEVGKMNIVPADYDITQMINEISEMTRVKAAEKNLVFNLEISPDIPRYLHGDDIKIKQIITNLLSNAVKYTEHGSVTLKIRCDGINNDSALLNVTVEDTGIGIKDEDKERLFAKFERLEESRNRSIEGTGLGLSICRSLLEMMGSKLEFISSYGCGSVFGFTLRQEMISNETVGDSKSYGNGRSKGFCHLFSAPKAKILVVDDNKMNLEVVNGLLRGTLLRIDTALSGSECLEMIDKEHYEMILLDHMMPVMDGIEVLERIRSGSSLCRDVPVIMLTANAVSGSKQMYIDKGFDDYLSKPVDGAELERLIMHYLPHELVLPPEKPLEEPFARGKRHMGAFCRVNAEVGMRYVGNIASVYDEMLEIYYAKSGENAEKAETSFKSKNLAGYEIAVHSMKSTSLGIGAEALSEMAKALENAVRDGDWEYIQNNHSSAMEEYRLVIAEISEYLGK